MNIKRLNLATQIGLVFAFIVALFTITLIFGVLQVGRTTIKDNIETDLEVIANEEGIRFGSILDQQVAFLSLSVAQNEGVITEVNSANDGYTSQSEDEITQALLEQDAKWRADPSENNTFVSNILTLDLSQDLVRYRNNVSDQVETFITDSHGALIATNNITSDYYQADEEWWQVAWNNGEGGIYIGGIELDESANTLSIELAIPIRDHDTDKVIGVVKSVYDIGNLVEITDAFSLGDTGHLHLIDQNGKLIEIDQEETPKDYLQDGLIYRQTGVNFDLPPQSDRDVIIGFAPIQSQSLHATGIQWAIIIEQDRNEAFEAINNLQNTLALVTVLGLAFALTFAFFIGQGLSRGIRQLSRTAQEFGQGKLDIRASEAGSLEIVELAHTFNAMADNLQTRSQELLELNESLDQQVQNKTAELRLALNEAREATRLKDEFLSVMSHELRTPLNAIMGYQGLLKMTGNLADKNLQKVERTLTNATRLLNLINDVLDISRIEAGRLEIVPSDIKIREFVGNIESQMQILANEKNLEFQVSIDDAVPETIHMDEDSLYKIINNLLGNSFKFTEEGSVKLSLNYADKNLIIEVLDTGIGIPTHLQEIIFDKFRQVDSSSKRQYGGSGLGLAIVNQIVQVMEGKISVKSTPNEGSIFTAIIPVQTVIETA